LLSPFIFSYYFIFLKILYIFYSKSQYFFIASPAGHSFPSLPGKEPKGLVLYETRYIV